MDWAALITAGTGLIAALTALIKVIRHQSDHDVITPAVAAPPSVPDLQPPPVAPPAGH